MESIERVIESHGTQIGFHSKEKAKSKWLKKKNSNRRIRIAGIEMGIFGKRPQNRLIC
jgi:hypothetical protein